MGLFGKSKNNTNENVGSQNDVNSNSFETQAHTAQPSTFETKVDVKQNHVDNDVPSKKDTSLDRVIIEKPKEIDVAKIKPKKFINTSLCLNVKIYNSYIDYTPSDFTQKLVKDLFIDRRNSNIPAKAKINLELTPNDVEKNLKVVVSIDQFYKNGVLVKKNRLFKPFYIIGFQTYTLLVVDEKPRESLYRINYVHNFAYREAQKIRGKRLSSRMLDPRKSNYMIEQDFIRARESKNWYIEQYINKLNKIPNIQWECIPQCDFNWSTRILKIKLYIKIDKIKNDIKVSKVVYADQFRVKLNNVLDFTNEEKKEIDIDTIMYLVALNAMYKSVKIFSYNTLYLTYKLLTSILLEKGYKLRDINIANLSSLKIVDFSSHFFCKRMMFNDRLLHIMNLMSSHEEYYRMKYALTTQKNPSLLYSDFIVSEFKNKTVDELSTILKNQENDYWNKKILELDQTNANSRNINKDFYINNFNVLDISNNKYDNVEDFLMGIIKEDKDEITRIAKLGEEILRLDENPRFSQKELNEIKKASKKLDNDYKTIFSKKSKTKKDKLYI